MDDNFDSLIYIIITIVAFVISALGKKKKKSAQRVAPVNREEPPQRRERPFLSNLEQLLNEELGINNQSFTNQFEEKVEVRDKPEVVQKKEDPIDSVPPEMLDDKEEVPYSIEFDDTNEIYTNSVKDAELLESEDESSLADFNLEDAIIYSEIINRKEY